MIAAVLLALAAATPQNGCLGWAGPFARACPTPFAPLTATPIPDAKTTPTTPITLAYARPRLDCAGWTRLAQAYDRLYFSVPSRPHRLMAERARQLRAEHGCAPSRTEPETAR